MAFLTGFYFLKLAFLGLILGPLKQFTRHGHKLYKTLKQKLLFSEILLIIIEGYLDFGLAYFIYVQYSTVLPETEASSERFQEFCMYMIIILVFISGHGSMIYVIRQRKETLQS